MTNLEHIIYMGGHGIYVWSAYISVLCFLGCQWFFSWRKWKKFLSQNIINNEQTP